MSIFLQNFDIPRRIFREIVPLIKQEWPTIVHPSQLLQNDANFEININLRDTNPNEYHVEIVEDDPCVLVVKREFEEPNGNGDKEKGSRKKVATIAEFVVPKNVYDLKKFEAKVSTDGVLTLTAPKIKKEPKKGWKIPIKTTGEAFKAKL